MILSGSAVHVNGLGAWFVSATKRLMVAWRSTTHRKTPRFSRRLASLAKNPSTALSHEHAVGVFRDHSSSPMGGVGGRIGPGERHNTLGDIRPEWWDARGSCLITQEA